MTTGNRSTAAACLAIGAGLASAQPIDDFESYADTAELANVWVENPGCAPATPALVLVDPFEGSQAMSASYDMGVDPFFGCLQRVFASPQDWRSVYKIEWAMRRAGGVSNDTIIVNSDDINGLRVFEQAFNTQADIGTDWQTYDLNLTVAGARNTGNINQLSIIPVGGTDFGQGDVFFDAFRLVPVPDADVPLEDFEGYADQTGLETNWSVSSVSGGGVPNSTISLTTSPDRGQAVRLDYANNADPFFSQARLTFAENQDFSGYATVTVWYQTFFEGPPFANSTEDVTIKLENEFGETIAGAQANQGSQSGYFEWWPLVIDLATASTEPGISLQDVRQISLSVEPDFDSDCGGGPGSCSYGVGIVLFDDLSASLAAPTGCNAADLAADFGILDLADINAFVSGFLAQDPIADLAEPSGVFDLNDISTFIAAFTAGCP